MEGGERVGDGIKRGKWKDKRIGKNGRGRKSGKWNKEREMEVQ